MKKFKKFIIGSLLPLFITACASSQINNAPNSASIFSVETHKDIKYIPNSNNFFHTADLYIPQNKKDYPMVIFVHGGNWNAQDKNYFGLFTGLYGNVGQALAKRGIGTLVINYRKTPEVNIEGMISDIVASINWVSENIKKYNGNPDKIFLSGHSAGGHLASLLAVNTQLTQINNLNKKIKGLIALSPILDIKNMETISRPDYNESVTYKTFGRTDEELRKYSPTTYFDKNTLPIFIIIGQNDFVSVRNQSYSAKEVLPSLGIKSKFLEIPGLDHSGVILSVDKNGDKISDPVARFIFENSKL